MSAGLDRHGPAASDYVGRVEAAAMVRAWRAAPAAALAHARARHALDARSASAARTSDGRPVACAVGGRHAVPDRLGGGARAAVRRHRRSTSRAAARRWTTAGPTATRSGSTPGGVPRRRAAAGRAGRAADDRLDARRGHQGGRRADPRGRRRGDRGLGHRAAWWSPASRTSSSSTSRRPRSTTASTTRAATPTSAGCRRCSCSASSAKLAGQAGARGAGAPRPFAFDPKNGVAPDGPPYSAGAASGSIIGQPARRRTGGCSAPTFVLAGRPAGPGPARGPRVRDRPAPQGARRWVSAGLATSGWRCCGRSTARAATR